MTAYTVAKIESWRLPPSLG